jgi:hypothetical protein
VCFRRNRSKGLVTNAHLNSSLLATGSKPPSKIDHHDGTRSRCFVGSRKRDLWLANRTTNHCFSLTTRVKSILPDSSLPPPNLPANQTIGVCRNVGITRRVRLSKRESLVQRYLRCGAEKPATAICQPSRGT